MSSCPVFKYIATHQKTTEPRSSVTYTENLVKIGYVVSEIYERHGRPQTDTDIRYTNHNILLSHIIGDFPIKTS